MYIYVYKSKADKKELNCNKNKLRKRQNNILCFFYRKNNYVWVNWQNTYIFIGYTCILYYRSEANNW